MAIKTIDDASLYNIANAIRDKLKTDETYLPSEMAEKIESIPTGSPWVSEMTHASYLFEESFTFEGFEESPDFTSVINANSMLERARNWQKDIDLYLPNCTTARQMLLACGSQNIQTGVQLPGFNVKIEFPNVTDIFQMCLERLSYEFPAIKSVELITSNSLIFMRSAFSGCSLMTKCSISNTTNNALNDGNGWASVFESCRKLSDLSELDMKYCGNLDNTFYECNSLKSVNVVNDEIGYTRSSFRANNMFYNCSSLVNIPVINLYDVNGTYSDRLSNMFYGCPNLSDASLINVLQSCLTVRNYGAKTLYHLGFRETDYPLERWESLGSIWDDFIDPQSGWSTGY